MPNPLGDFVMATGTLSALKAHYTNANFHIVSHYPSLLPGWSVSPVGEKLHTHFELGILFPNSISSAWHFVKNGVKQRLGYVADGRRLLLNLPVKFPEGLKSQHLVQTYHDLLRPLGIEETNPPHLEPKPELAQAIFLACGIDPSRPVVGINAGAGYGPAKCWLKERFAQVARKLTCEAGVQVVLFGTPDMEETNAFIAQHAPVIDLCGKTALSELVSCIAAIDVLLTNDSGPMHIASALKTPLVALFGSTSAVKTGPYQWGKVIHKHADCSPCYKKRCPIDFRCMRAIEVDEVYNEVMQCLT